MLFGLGNFSLSIGLYTISISSLMGILLRSQDLLVTHERSQHAEVVNPKTSVLFMTDITTEKIDD